MWIIDTTEKKRNTKRYQLHVRAEHKKLTQHKRSEHEKEGVKKL